VLGKALALATPEEQKEYIVSELNKDILQDSREIALEYLDESLRILQETGFLTEELSDIPRQIIDQVKTRF
jgi:hypothetical protein